MKKLKDILNEVLLEASPQTKIFDQGSLNDIMNQIRKAVGIPKDDSMMDQKVEYTEYRFGDGTGGFTFKWSHSRQRGGNLGLSLAKDGDHTLYVQSWYGDKKFGDEKIKPRTLPTPAKDFLRGIRTWKDLDNLAMQTIVTVLSKDIKKNEKDAERAFEQERKGQSDFYSGGGKGYFKQGPTGRIGYGL